MKFYRGVRRLTRTLSAKQSADSYDQLESCRMTLKPLKNNDPMNNTGSELLNGFDEPSTSTSLSQ